MWGGYEKNVYYSPEKCGVEIIASVEADLSYEFDISLLVKHEDKFYIVQDQGCSCPTPFEDVNSPSDMIQVHDMSDVRRLVRAGTSSYSYSAADVQDFYRKARKVFA